VEAEDIPSDRLGRKPAPSPPSSRATTTRRDAHDRPHQRQPREAGRRQVDPVPRRHPQLADAKGILFEGMTGDGLLPSLNGPRDSAVARGVRSSGTGGDWRGRLPGWLFWATFPRRAEARVSGPPAPLSAPERFRACAPLAAGSDSSPRRRPTIVSDERSTNRRLLDQLG
jgi:hypothetical protein